MAPRILLTPIVSKDFFIDSRRLLQILATNFSPKTRAKNEREKKNGRDGRVRRKLGIITVAKELVRNEEGRAFIYTWEARVTPLE